MMMLLICTIYLLLMLLNDIFANTIEWRMYPKVEMIISLLQIVSTIVIVRIQLTDMKNIYNHENGGYDKTYLLCKTFFYIGVNIMLYIAFNKLKQLDRMQKQLEIIKVENDKQLEKYIELNKKYEETSKIAHDVRKHMEILETLIKENNSDVEKYKEHLYGQLDKMTNVFKCENRILSIIMSQKMLEAESKNIKVDIDMVDSDFNAIEDIDMTAIFVNLWDNAIEASMKLDEDRRKIDIIIGKTLNSIVVSFDNVYDGNIVAKGKKFLSAKGVGHGYGLTIIKEAIRKYKGTCKFENNDELFCVKIIIPINM